MNNHLNVFRFHNESDELQFIENNLSRALALCLKYDSLFFTHFVREIVIPEDYSYLFSVYANDAEYNVDVQVDMSSITIEGIRKVYAIAMTAHEKLDMSAFLENQQNKEKQRNVTDIWISIKDIAFVIEVKRGEEDCRNQLYNQVYPFIKTDDHNKRAQVVPICFSWQDVTNTMEQVQTIQKLTGLRSIFIDDFLKLSETRYPNWFVSKPFSILPFSQQQGSALYHNLTKRLIQGINKSEYELLGYNDRLAIRVSYGWASEVIPQFRDWNESNVEAIVFYIWPGNTKQQGYNIFNRTLDWTKKDHLIIDEKKYELDIAYNTKFCHFNKFISGFTFYDDDIKKTINTAENFYTKSGKWDIGDWQEFERFMDEHFVDNFKWRERAQWDEKFKNTDRNYFTFSLGYEVAVIIPYHEFKEIDKKAGDIELVGKKIGAIIKAFEGLLC